MATALVNHGRGRGSWEEVVRLTWNFLPLFSFAAQVSCEEIHSQLHVEITDKRIQLGHYFPLLLQTHSSISVDSKYHSQISPYQLVEWLEFWVKKVEHGEIRKGLDLQKPGQGWQACRG